MKPQGISSKQWRLFNLYFILEHFIGINFSEKYLRKRKEKLYTQASENNDIFKRNEKTNLLVIDCSNEQFDFPDENRLLKSPILFKKAASNWPCMNKWSEDFFLNKMGDYSFDLKYKLGFSKDDDIDTHSNLASFIKKMKNDQKSYLRFSKIIEDKPELKQDLDLHFINRFKNEKNLGEEYYFFMGEANTKTGLHTEITQTLSVQVSGKKKWTLFAPEERFFFDPVANRMQHFLSYINPEKPDNEKYPIYKHVKKYEIILEPGDVLWFPAYYWHYVENLTSSIGIAYKNLNLKNSFNQSKVLSTLFFLRTKPNIINPFAAIKRKLKSSF